jgi:diaminopimelate epimerase
MRFTKMHGTGNDYIYINCFQEDIQAPEKLVMLLSDRHTGIGSDGLVLIQPSDRADFRMQMFNPDGSEAQMCGNAARCVGKYVYDHQMTSQTVLSLETRAGIKTLQLFPDVTGQITQVCVDMGEPQLAADRIPVILPAEQVINRWLDLGEERYPVTCVSMGNPHTILFMPHLDGLDLPHLGSMIEHASCFPERTNVEFVQLLSPQRARVRVWERGTGETQACGTGACAVLVAGVLTGQLERQATVSLPGGDLWIRWKENNHLYLTGNAVTVFEGNIHQTPSLYPL